MYCPSEDGVVLVAEEDHVQTVRDRDQAERQGPELRRIELESGGRNEDAEQPDHLDGHVAHPGGRDPVSVLIVDGEILMEGSTLQHSFRPDCKLVATQMSLNP